MIHFHGIILEPISLGQIVEKIKSKYINSIQNVKISFIQLITFHV